MKNQSPLSSQFQRKISTFCDVRIAPLVSPRELNNLRPYLLSLIIYRKYPPTRSGRTDWLSIQAACGFETVMSSALRKTLQSGLEAIVRWIDKEQSGPDDGGRTIKVANRARRSMRASQFLDIVFSKSRTSVSLKSGRFAEVGPWQPGYHQG